MIFPELDPNKIPKRPVTHMMLDEYFKQRIDKEVSRLTKLIEAKIGAMGSLAEDVKKLKNKMGMISPGKPKKSKFDELIEESDYDPHN